MEIKKGKTSSGEQTIKFVDQTDSNISLWIEEHLKQGKGTKLLYLDTDDDYFKFSQEDIKSLLPYLQSFADSGQLEPQQSPSVTSAMEHGDSLLQKYSELPQPRLISIDPTLQGGDDFLDVANELATMQEAGVAMAQNIVEQGKRIQALEMLVERWRDMASETYGDNEDIRPDDFLRLCKKTAQLLNESE